VSRHKGYAPERVPSAAADADSNADPDSLINQFLNIPSRLSSIGSGCFLSTSLSADTLIDERDSRSPLGSRHIDTSEPDDGGSVCADEKKFITAVAILNKVGDKLRGLQEATVGMHADPNNPLLFTWQVISLVVVSMYETVVEIIDRGVLSQSECRSDSNFSKFEQIRTECLDHIYSLLEANLSFLMKKIPSMKIVERAGDMVGSLNEVAFLVRRLTRIAASTGGAQTSTAQRANKKCCEILLHILRLFQKESVKKVTALDFGDQSSQRRGGVCNDDDDLMDDLEQDASLSQNSKKSYSQYSRYPVLQSSQQDEDGSHLESGIARRRDGAALVTTYSSGLLKCFISVSQSIVLLDQKKRDTVSKAIDLFSVFRGHAHSC
jgi:hypothetical protein